MSYAFSCRGIEIGGVGLCDEGHVFLVGSETCLENVFKRGVNIPIWVSVLSVYRIRSK